MLKTLLKKSTFFLCAIMALFFSCHAYSMHNAMEQALEKTSDWDHMSFRFTQDNNLECFDSGGTTFFIIKKTSDGKLLEHLAKIITNKKILEKFNQIQQNHNLQFNTFFTLACSESKKSVVALIPTIIYAECPELDPTYKKSGAQSLEKHRKKFYQKLSTQVNGDPCTAQEVFVACKTLHLSEDVCKRVFFAARESLGVIAARQFDTNVSNYTVDTNVFPTIDYVQNNLTKGPDRYCIPLEIHNKYESELCKIPAFETYIQSFKKNPHHPLLKVFDDQLTIAIHHYNNSFFGSIPQVPNWYTEIIKHNIKTNPQYSPPAWFYTLQKITAESTIKNIVSIGSAATQVALTINSSEAHPITTYLPFIATAATVAVTALYNNSTENLQKATSRFNKHLKKLDEARAKKTYYVRLQDPILSESDLGATLGLAHRNYCLNGILAFAIHAPASKYIATKCTALTASLLSTNRLNPNSAASCPPTPWVEMLFPLAAGAIGRLFINSSEHYEWHDFKKYMTPAAQEYFATKTLSTETYAAKSTEYATVLRKLPLSICSKPRYCEQRREESFIEELQNCTPKLTLVHELTKNRLFQYENPDTKQFGIEFNTEMLQLPKNLLDATDSKLIETSIPLDLKVYILQFIYRVDPPTKIMIIPPIMRTNQDNAKAKSLAIGEAPFSPLQKTLFLNGWNIRDVYEYSLQFDPRTQKIYYKP